MKGYSIDVGYKGYIVGMGYILFPTETEYMEYYREETEMNKIDSYNDT